MSTSLQAPRELEAHDLSQAGGEIPHRADGAGSEGAGRKGSGSIIGEPVEIATDYVEALLAFPSLERRNLYQYGFKNDRQAVDPSF